MNDILEIEFQLAYSWGIPPTFNDMEFFDFIWFYERIAEQKQKENENENNMKGKTSIANLFGGNKSG